jgi:hypothetical protein
LRFGQVVERRIGIVGSTSFADAERTTCAGEGSRLGGGGVAIGPGPAAGPDST